MLALLCYLIEVQESNFFFRLKKAPKIIKKYKGDEIIITNPLLMPDPHHIEEYYEPFVLGKDLINHRRQDTTVCQILYLLSSFINHSPLLLSLLMASFSRCSRGIQMYRSISRSRHDNHTGAVHRSRQLPLPRQTRLPAASERGRWHHHDDTVHPTSFWGPGRFPWHTQEFDLRIRQLWLPGPWVSSQPINQGKCSVCQTNKT